MFWYCFSKGEIKADVVKVDSAANIYKLMVNSGHMQLYLNYILGEDETINLEFQSEHYRLEIFY